MLIRASIPPPHAIGVAHRELRLEETRPTVAEDSEQRDPVQELAGHVAGPGQSLAGRVVQEVVDFSIAEITENRVDPADVRTAGVLPAWREMAAHVERKAPAGHHRDVGGSRQRVDRLADHPAQGETAPG